MGNFSQDGHLVSSPDGACSSFLIPSKEQWKKLTIHRVNLKEQSGLACNRWIRQDRDEWVRESGYAELFFPNISPSNLIKKMHEGKDVQLAKMALGFIRK